MFVNVCGLLKLGAISDVTSYVSLSLLTYVITCLTRVTITRCYLLNTAGDNINPTQL